MNQLKEWSKENNEKRKEITLERNEWMKWNWKSRMKEWNNISSVQVNPRHNFGYWVTRSPDEIHHCYLQLSSCRQLPGLLFRSDFCSRNFDGERLSRESAFDNWTAKNRWKGIRTSIGVQTVGRKDFRNRETLKIIREKC